MRDRRDCVEETTKNWFIRAIPDSCFAAVRRREEYDLRALLLESGPVVPLVDVKAALHADCSEICLEDRWIHRAGTGSFCQLILGRVHLVVSAGDLSASVE